VRFYPYLALEEYYNDRSLARQFAPYRQLAEKVVTIPDIFRYPKRWWTSATDDQVRTALRSLTDYNTDLDLSKVGAGVLTVDDLARAAAVNKHDIVPPDDIAEQWYTWPPRAHQSVDDTVAFRVAHGLSVPLADVVGELPSHECKKLLMHEKTTPDQRSVLLECVPDRRRPRGEDWADAIEDNSWSQPAKTSLLQWLKATDENVYQATLENLQEPGVAASFSDLGASAQYSRMR
jgi:hypothetical protein